MMNSSQLMRILIVDDHPMVREGLAALLNAQAGMSVIAEASTGEEALELFLVHRPDVTLLDVRLPGLSGIEVAVRILRDSPQARLLVMSNLEGDEQIHRALAAGVLGYLFKTSAREDVVAAVRAVHAGRKFIPSAVASRLAEFMPRTELSAREREVLKLIGDGFRNKEIAGSLDISESTVKEHVRNLMSKLHVTDRTHALSTAIRRGLLLID